MFTVLVAADVFGSKVNLELPLAGKPSLVDLSEQVTEAFRAETEEARPPGAPPFKVSRFQLFDEREQRWVDLVSASQLHDFCQTYAFQPPSQWHKEVQAPIPAPVRPRMVPASIRRPRVTSVDNATHDDKVRGTFEELDSNGNKVIEQEELQRGLHLLAIDFSPATIRDLFSKSDANRDGVISFPEWQRVCELYPTLLDCLYFRFRAYWEDMRLQQEIQQARAMQADLEQAQRASGVAWQEAQRGVETASRQLHEQDKALHEACEAQRSCEEVHRDAQRDVDTAAKDMARVEDDLALQCEKERQKGASYNDAQRDVDEAQRRQNAAEGETARAMGRERQANGQLADAKNEADQQKSRTAAAGEDLRNAKGMLQDAATAKVDAAGATDMAERALEECERRVALSQQQERKLAEAHRNAEAAVQRAQQARSEEERLLSKQRDHEQACNQNRLAAERETEEQANKVKELEGENEAFNVARRQAEEREQPLLEQEIRLREQRDSLEEKESMLRQEHRVFYETAWRAPSPEVGSPRSSRFLSSRR
eukprot:Sspe_Gene.65247::Locus_38631_Transcript_1_1_Confidence_1.000_Length_1899::g.65247::m.65247